MLQRCGPKAFECFCASLEHSGQLTLLKSLKPDWQDGNCVGAIHKPTDKEIEANERYYSVEKRVYTGLTRDKEEIKLIY